MFQKIVIFIFLFALSSCSDISLRRSQLKSPPPATNLYSLALVSTSCGKNNLLTAVIQQKGAGTLYYADPQYVSSESHSAVLAGNTVTEWKYTVIFKPASRDAKNNSFQINVYAVGLKANVIRISNTVLCPI